MTKEEALANMRALLANAERNLNTALRAYEGGGVVVEYDSDYYEGQVEAYDWAVKVLEELTDAT